MRLNYIIKHEDYPWLIINPDGVEVAMGFTEEDVKRSIEELGKIPEIRTIEETKTISGRTADMWESGIPIGYVGQVSTYQMPFKEINPDISGNIWSKKDGREFEGHPVPWNDTLANRIDEDCAAFWELVKEGKSIMAAGHTVSQVDHLLDNLAPRPVNPTPNYDEFLSQRLKEKQARTIVCPDEMLELGFKYLALNQEKKEAENRFDQVKMKIKEFMDINNALVLDAGKQGKISFSRRLYVNIKN